MLIKQLSIFLENRVGRLAEITGIIAKNDINLRSISIADTSRFGVLRIIVDNPEDTEKILKQNGITLSVTELVAVKISDVPGGLSGVLAILAGGGISIEYMYSVNDREDGNAYVVMRVNDNSAAQEMLKAGGYTGFDSIK